MRTATRFSIAPRASERAVLQRNESARNRRIITFVLLPVVIVPGVIGFALDMATMVRTAAVLQGAIGFGVLLLIRPNQHADRRLVVPLAAILALGTVVGAFYAADGSNSFSRWAVYSGLSITWITALMAGERIGRGADRFLLVRVVLMLCAIDAVMLVPRFAIVGLQGRTSWGYSPWAAAAAVSLAIPGLSRRERLLAGAVVVSSLVGTVLSGMRSAVLVTLLLFGIATLYLFRNWHRTWVRRVAFAMFVGAVCVVGAVEYFGLSEAAQRQADLVTARLNATLLNEDGVVLDEGSGGRELEAREAMAEFERRGAWQAWAIGYGHGFQFYNSSLDKLVAHVHISPLAFFIRYGVLGLLYYVVLLVAVTWNALRAFLGDSISSEGALRFVAQLAVVAIVGGGIIAGSMMSPLSWFAVGFGSAIGKSSVTRT